MQVEQKSRTKLLLWPRDFNPELLDWQSSTSTTRPERKACKRPRVCFSCKTNTIVLSTTYEQPNCLDDLLHYWLDQFRHPFCAALLYLLLSSTLLHVGLGLWLIEK